MVDPVLEVPPDSLFSSSRWKGSVFNHVTAEGDGSFLLYNSVVGAVARVGCGDSDMVRRALQDGFAGMPLGPLAELTLNGFFVAADLDELAWAAAERKRHRLRGDILELSLLPTEQCNFRCTYCYQSFLRGKMQRNVIEGVVEYVRRRSGSLGALQVGWFGGEPLAAADVVEDIAGRLVEICSSVGARYSSSMVTNGYLLDAKMAQRMFRAHVRDFQITLDGSPEDHNRLRLLADRSSGTFERVFANLLALRDQPEPFRAIIRFNFDPDSAKRMEPFVARIGDEFADDPRFFVDFHPVGHWGGPNDQHVPVCQGSQGELLQSRFFGAAAENGLNVRALRQRLEPSGSVCYAANPHSFVIGSDGKIYKCTVAFEDQNNQVGRITEDGRMLLDDRKFQLWTGVGPEQDESCSACFFQPSCQGNACPLERIRSGAPPCPSVKRTIDQSVRMIATDAIRRSRAQSFVQISL